MNKIIKIVAVSLIVIFIGGVIYALASSGIKSYQEKKANQTAELSAIKLVDATCPNCFKMDSLLDILKKENVVFKDIKEVDVSSEEGNALISQHNITKIPILIITGDIEKNEPFTKLWEGFGQKKDKTLISDVFPPYKNLNDSTTIGLVDLTVIYDSTCTECYNSKMHDVYLAAEGIYPVNTNKLDASSQEAKDLIAKYNIKKIPTVILTPEAKYYKNLTEKWVQDGFIADDGYYIFTAPEKIGTYKDLETNEIIKNN
ncbi:MAG: hypothetical protein WC752_03105 [Patescibacteria group bacterium]|jgi:thiol-disulfide isomerase/thioredoxin